MRLLFRKRISASAKMLSSAWLDLRISKIALWKGWRKHDGYFLLQISVLQVALSASKLIHGH